MINDQSTTDPNSGMIHLKLEEKAGEKLRAVANSNGVSMDKLLQEAIIHGLTLLSSDPTRDSKETTPTFLPLFSHF
jgi:hypothetical protein